MVRGTLQFRLFAALTLLPIVVAGVLTYTAVRLFRQDKELYVSDFSTQNADLVARILTERLATLRALAASGSTEGGTPFLSLRHKQGQAQSPGPRTECHVENASRPDDLRLSIECSRAGAMLAMEVRPAALLDLKGFGGPTELMVVNDAGQVLVSRDARWLAERRNVRALVRRLRLFDKTSARLGSTEVEIEGQPTLVAFARATPSMAVMLSISKRAVAAAAAPLIATAVAVSAATVVIVVLLGLFVGRRIAAPLRAVARQAAAIGRGEFGVAVEMGGSTSGQMAQLLDSFNEMSASLERREVELAEAQRQLLQSERLNTATRMIGAIASELSAPLERCFSLAGESSKKLPPDSEVAAWQREIVLESDRAANLLQNLKRIAARGEEALQTIDADLVLTDVLVSARAVLSQNALSLESRIEEGLHIRAKPDELHHALLDALMFVSEHATAGSSVEIVLEQQPEGAGGDVAALEMTYTGTPLAAGEIDPIKAPQNISGEQLLLLTVAASVLRDHGGALTVVPSEKGSTIRATLPLAGGA